MTDLEMQSATICVAPDLGDRLHLPNCQSVEVTSHRTSPSQRLS